MWMVYGIRMYIDIHICIYLTVIKQLMFKDYQTMSSEWNFMIVIQYIVIDEKWTAENSSGYGWGGKCSLLQWTWKDFGSWMCLDIDLSCDPPWRIKGGNCVGRYSKVFRSSCFDIVVLILYDIIFIQILHQVITWRCYRCFLRWVGVTFWCHPKLDLFKLVTRIQQFWIRKQSKVWQKPIWWVQNTLVQYGSIFESWSNSVQYSFLEYT